MDIFLWTKILNKSKMKSLEEVVCTLLVMQGLQAELKNFLIV